LRVDPIKHLHLLADRRFDAPDRGALRLPRGDMVYPPGSDSAILADVVSLVDGGEVLDLCSGSGIQGLAVASASRHVTAVDIGPRAVAMGGANAALNGIANFATLGGDLYHPVRERRFDLIIANPPFVPSPKRGPAYHSGGPRGDRVLRRIVARWGAHLKPDGRAFAISHLAVRRGEDVAAVCRPWLADFPGRALVLVLESGSPIDLAAAQALFALDRGFAAYAREIRSWVTYLKGHRIEKIVLLLLVAVRGRSRRFEVAEAFQRTLPLPLSRPPRDILAGWLGG
jgi:carbamoyltransferase